MLPILVLPRTADPRLRICKNGRRALPTSWIFGCREGLDGPQHIPAHEQLGFHRGDHALLHGRLGTGFAAVFSKFVSYSWRLNHNVGSGGSDGSDWLNVS